MADVTLDLLMSPQRLQAMREHNRLTEPATTWDRVLELTHAAYQRAGLSTTIESGVIDLRRRMPAATPSVRRFVRP
jgi:hypothetical protein